MTVTNTSELAALREDIDSIDDALLDLLRRRVRTCERIADYKRDNGVPMMQQDRLDALRGKLRDYAAAHELDEEFLADVFDVVTQEACRLEDAVIEGRTASNGLAGRARRIDHVAIAVRDLEQAITMFRDRYGFAVLERRQVQGEVSGMDSATLRAGGVTFVLCQGDSPRSNVSQYIEHYGPGVQHIAIAVRGQRELLDDLADRGADLLTGVINAPGLDQSFTKREANTGVQLEFVTRTDNDGFSDNNVRELFAAMERENVY
jgi:chorismate mutase-like protein